MATKRPPRSALGNPPLNPIQKAFFHLLAGLLDLLKPDFARSRGARRMPFAHRLRGRAGARVRARRASPPSLPSAPPSRPTFTYHPRTLEGVGGVGTQLPRLSEGAWIKKAQLFAAVAARDGRGGLGTPWGFRGRA